MSRKDVENIEPTERTIAQWRVLVDWDLFKQRQYVIVDPMDPAGLLYLTQKDYLAYAKVSASTDFNFIVVCRPGAKRPESLVTPNNSSNSDSSQNSPWGVIWDQNSKVSKNSRWSWRAFQMLRNRIHLLVSKIRIEDKMVSENLNSITRTVLVWARQLAHYAEVKNPGAVPLYLVSYVSYMKRILKNNGQMALVLHLKVALFALYSYISGNPITSTYALGSGMRLDRSGLPLAWGPTIRRLIREGNIDYIRLMASLLNIYRAMDAPHKDADISTIIRPHPDYSKNDIFKDFQYFCREILPSLLKRETQTDLKFKYESGLGLIIRSAGANVSGPAMSSIVMDAQAWYNQPENHVKSWFEMHQDSNAVKLLENFRNEHHFPMREDKDIREGLTTSLAFMATRSPFSSGLSEAMAESSFTLEGTPRPILGRLHAIDEPAGKVRVVAICDYWTQVAMKPVHDHLFSILKRMKTDATFDQSGIVSRYYQRGLFPHWSFDLKAATDTIPLALYIEVMAVVLQAEGETYMDARNRASLWSKVMTDRDFLTPSKEGYAKYGTGQPMGALSSWASMALVHHALVQFSHWRSYQFENLPSWYPDYLVLGDDIDIARCRRVAENYQYICAELGIIIGLIKSLRSNKNTFEFANMRFCPDGNISPLSLKEELASTTWNARLEYSKRIIQRFGTRYQRPEMALIRKATTVQQWDALVPELSGSRRETHYLNAVRFALQNPFTFLKEGKPIAMSAIIEWIALILSKENRDMLNKQMADPTQQARISVSLSKELLRLLEMDIKKALDSLLPQRAIAYFDTPALTDEQHAIVRGLGKFLHHRDLSDKRFDLLPSNFIRSKILEEALENAKFDTKEIGNKDGSYRTLIHATVPDRIGDLLDYLQYFWDPRSPLLYDASTSILYSIWCFKQHNKKVEEDLEDLKRSVMVLKSLIRGESEVQVAEANAAVKKMAGRFGLENVEDILHVSLTMWARFTSTPKVIVPNFSESINSWLPGKVDIVPPVIEVSKTPDRKVARVLQVLEERIRGPIRALGSCLAANFGILLPVLPHLAFEKATMKENTWNVILQKISNIHMDTRNAVSQMSDANKLASRLLYGVHHGYMRAAAMELESLHKSMCGDEALCGKVL
jgi:hypothetical protein